MGVVSLHDYDEKLDQQLQKRLLSVLSELLEVQTLPEVLASQVIWTVRSGPDGLWLRMSLPDGYQSEVGGEWPDDHASLLWYVDDLAYRLAGLGGAPD
jgi:hypothetical protein